MERIEQIEAMRVSRGAWRARDERVALVPTMGALHEGHLTLIKQAAAAADHVVVSLFVNPTQFGPGEDFQRYPRDLERDAQLCEDAGVDLLFSPALEDMYAPDHTVYVEEVDVARQLEGMVRPGHFRGVLTVVAKLFLAVQPDVAVFGQKDAQQLWLILRMVRDLNFPVQIVTGPTVREADGLALSSRNAYLEPDQRAQATCLYRALQAARTRYADGERNVYVLRKVMMDVVEAEPDAEMDYIEIVDEQSFAPVTTVLRPARALVAVRLGKTRLIDNERLGDDGG